MTPNPDRETVLYLRIPLHLKGEIAKWAKRSGMSQNAWAANVLRLAVRGEYGMPDPPPAVAPLATPAEALRAYLAEETILTPCGERTACPGTESDPEMLHGIPWCRACGIRLG